MHAEIKNSFKKIRHLRKEVEILQKRRIKQDIVTDSVTGSDSEPPYCPRTIKIEGIDVGLAGKLNTKYQKIIKTLQGEIENLEDLLEGLEDVELRNILRMRYVFGMKQEEIARELGYSRGTIASKISRFFSKS